MGMMAVRTAQNVWRLWRAGDRVTEAKQALVEAQAENQQLQARLAEVQSDEYVEKEAREKLGYGREGEVILLLPKGEQAGLKEVREEKKPNWEQWWEAYIRI